MPGPLACLTCRVRQQLEDILDALRNAPEEINPTVINQGLAQLDIVRKAFEKWQRSLGGEVPPAEPTASETVVKESPVVVAAEVEAAPLQAPASLEESFTVRVPSNGWTGC